MTHNVRTQSCPLIWYATDSINLSHLSILIHQLLKFYANQLCLVHVMPMRRAHQPTIERLSVCGRIVLRVLKLVIRFFEVLRSSLMMFDSGLLALCGPHNSLVS